MPFWGFRVFSLLRIPQNFPIPHMCNAPLGHRRTTAATCPPPTGDGGDPPAALPPTASPSPPGASPTNRSRGLPVGESCRTPTHPHFMEVPPSGTGHFFYQRDSLKVPLLGNGHFPQLCLVLAHLLSYCFSGVLFVFLRFRGRFALLS